MGVGTVGSRRRRGHERTQAILDAALRVFARDGIGAASHRSIAAEAGVPIAATTYYFDSIDDLTEAAMTEFVRGERSRLESMATALANSRADGLMNDDEIFGAVIAALANGRRDRRVLELYVEAARHTGLRAAARECLSAYSRLVQVALDDFDATARMVVAPLLVALADGLAMHQMAEPTNRLFPEQIFPILRRLALTALRAGESAPSPHAVDAPSGQRQNRARATFMTTAAASPYGQ